MAESDVPLKKRKTSTDISSFAKVQSALDSFNGFEVKRVIGENTRSKSAVILGQINGQDAVVLLEKEPFDVNKIGKYLCAETSLKNTLLNDIYGTYEAFPPQTENAVKAVIIHPATEKHVQKYSDQEKFVVHETAELYEQVTLPLIKSKPFSIQWVYNILEKKHEADRIIYEDPDPELGFVLLPDMKWDRKDVNTMYLVAIVHKHDIKSLRDLDQTSLPLLKNILQKAQKAIEDTYNLPSSKIHAYVHYQPSYYHLHVHFSHIKMEAPGFGADRAHVLTDVIDNIELRNDFYQRKTLTFTVREQEDLYKCYKEAGYFEKS